MAQGRAGLCANPARLGRCCAQIPLVLQIESTPACRTVGIGAYLARLGRRCVQRADQPIILTGYSALNKLLGREVYTTNLQLGGPKVRRSDGCLFSSLVGWGWHVGGGGGDTLRLSHGGHPSIVRWASCLSAVLLHVTILGGRGGGTPNKY